MPGISRVQVVPFIITPNIHQDRTPLLDIMYRLLGRLFVRIHAVSISFTMRVNS